MSKKWSLHEVNDCFEIIYNPDGTLFKLMNYVVWDYLLNELKNYLEADN